PTRERVGGRNAGKRREVPGGSAACPGCRARRVGRRSQGAGRVTSVERLAVSFAEALRDEGLAAPTGSVAAYVDALAALGTDRPGYIYWAGRATLTNGPEQVAAYDRAFATFFLSRLAGEGLEDAVAVVPVVADDDDDGASLGIDSVND